MILAKRRLSNALFHRILRMCKPSPTFEPVWKPFSSRFPISIWRIQIRLCFAKKCRLAPEPRIRRWRSCAEPREMGSPTRREWVRKGKNGRSRECQITFPKVMIQIWRQFYFLASSGELGQMTTCELSLLFLPHYQPINMPGESNRFSTDIRNLLDQHKATNIELCLWNLTDILIVSSLPDYLRCTVDVV